MDFNPEDKTVVGLTLGQKVFDRYNLDRVLGQGAMGVVWLATDTVMNEPVALKFLPQVLAADPAALDEMKQEARQARRLTHENIVRIHDIVMDGNMAAISMEWVNGYTLSALRLKKANRVLDVDDLGALLPQIALGLDYAHHRAKVVHRDLKPSNLMVSQEGDLKITDFGIARSLTDTVTRLTKASTSGTPCYMSPQQMMGKRPDPKDDIYALGATLYELLTGKPPFYTGDLGMQILHAEVVSVAERRDELGIEGAPVPENWETAIQQCLSKDPNARFGTAAELVQAVGLDNARVQSLGGPGGIASPQGQASTGQDTGGEALEGRLKELQESADSPGAGGDAALIQQIQECIRGANYKDAQALMLSPELPEGDKERLEGEMQSALKADFREKEEKIKTFIEQDRVEEALELLRPAVENYPREFQPKEAIPLYSGVEKLSTLAALAETGEFDALKKEKTEWDQLEIPSEWKALLSRKSSDLVWNGVLARAQSKLKANQPSEAYRILSAYETSGLGDDRLETLRPRMEAIRQEVNKALEPEILKLENQVEKEALEPALLREAIRRLEVQYLSAKDRGADDPVGTRLQKLSRSAQAMEESDIPPPPPPVPKKAVREETGLKNTSEKDLEQGPSSATPQRKEKRKKSSTGLVLGLLFGVTLPLLIGVAFFVLYLPYQDGQKVLEYVDALIAEGEFQDASLELNWLEDTPMRSLFLKAAIAERRTALESDQVLRDYLASIPGLKNSFQEFRKLYPQGKVEAFTGSWDSLQGTIDRVAPGTIIVLQENDYPAFNPVNITQAVGLVGSESGTQIRVQVAAEASPLITSDGNDLLLANLSFQYEPVGEQSDTMIQMSNARFSFHGLQIQNAPTGILLENARGRLMDSLILNSFFEGLVAYSEGTDITLESVVFQSCNTGVIIDPGVRASLVDVEIYESSDVGIYASGDFQLNLTQSSINANNLGLEAAGGEISVEESSFNNNTNTGINVVNGARITLRGSRSNQNGEGLVLANAEARVVDSDFNGNTNGGIRITGASSRVRIENCNLVNNGKFGFKNELSNQVELLDSTLRNNQGAGVLFTGEGTQGTLRKCLLFANESHGISLREEAEVTVQASTFSENNGAGIHCIGPSSRVYVQGSDITKNTSNGIIVQRASNLSLVDSSVLENGMSGISINDSLSLGEITNTKVLRNGRHGIYFGGGSTGWVEDSQVEENEEAGILGSNSGTNVRIIRNTVTANQFGIVIQTGGKGEILNNESSGNENAGIGIYSDGSQATVSDNTLEQNQTYGLERTGDNTLNILQENAYRGNLQGDKRL